MSASSDNDDIHQYFVNLTIQFFEKYSIVQLKDKFLKLLKEFNIDIDDERETDEDCEECNGEGYNEDEQLCEECNGDGTVMVDNQNYGEIDEYSYYIFEKLDRLYYGFNEDLFIQIVNALKNQKTSDKVNKF